MRRIARLERSIALVQPRIASNLTSPHFCPSCRHQSLAFSTSTSRGAITTDSIRKKIWGTDNPPGLADPYGDESVFDQTKKTKGGSPEEEDVLENVVPEEPKQPKPRKQRKQPKRLAAKVAKPEQAARLTANKEKRVGRGKLAKKTAKEEREERVARFLVQAQVDQPSGKLEFKRNISWGKASRSVHHVLEAVLPEELGSDYIPAYSADGLMEIGAKSTEWERVWDRVHVPPRFLPVKEQDSEVITAALHRALVEVFTLRKWANHKVPNVKMLSPLQRSTDYTDYVRIRPSEDGGAVLKYREKSEKLDIIEAMFAIPQEPKVKSAKVNSAVPDETAEKANPTESEEDVAADRSVVDPLNPSTDQRTPDETVTKENPTESEEDVAADRSTIDPLKKKTAAKDLTTYAEFIASWGPAWLDISLADPEVKFAVRLPA